MPTLTAAALATTRIRLGTMVASPNFRHPVSFDEVLAAAGREPGSVDRFLSLDAAPVFSLSSAGYFADAVARAAEAGFTAVNTHWPRPAGPYAGDESVLEAVAADVLPHWQDQLKQQADRGQPPAGG